MTATIEQRRKFHAAFQAERRGYGERAYIAWLEDQIAHILSGAPSQQYIDAQKPINGRVPGPGGINQPQKVART